MVKKSYDELLFSDDFLFCMIMQDEELCKEVIEVLLGIKIRNVIVHNKQHNIDPSYDGHGIRLDVYMEDEDTVLDLEMQSISEEDLGLRSRYYQSMIDFEHLGKGAHYSQLKQSYVVFICKKNPFPALKELPELPVYKFTSCIQDKPQYKLNDKTVKAFYNASAWDSIDNRNLRAFLKYVTDGNPTSELTRKLEEAVLTAKKKEEWRSKYMTWSLAYEDLKFYARKEGLAEGLAEGREAGLAEGREAGLAEGRAEGRAEGESQAKLQSAVISVKEFGNPIEKVAEKFGVPLEDLQKALNN